MSLREKHGYRWAWAFYPHGKMFHAGNRKSWAELRRMGRKMKGWPLYAYAFGEWREVR